MSDRATNKARTIKVRAGWYRRGDVNLVACGAELKRGTYRKAKG